MSLQIVLSIAGLEAGFGGPSRSVPSLAEALSLSGGQVQLFTCRSKTSDKILLPDSKLVSSCLLPFANRSTYWHAAQNAFFGKIREVAAQSQRLILHDNGIWLPNNHAVAAAARKFKLPRLISPRGMLSAWAMGFKGWKKQIAWILYQRHDLKTATALHATSHAEAGELRRLGLTQPIALIPNGVEIPPQQLFKDPHRPSLRTVLFLSRIHPVKGIQDLISAWASIFNRQPSFLDGWKLVIAGPAEERYIEQLKQEIHRHSKAFQPSILVNANFFNSISFRGPVDGKEKWDLYRNSDIFVLPSRSENFGIVVAEALACGVPVITTQGTPWEDLISHQCGWWTEMGVEPLTSALQEAISRSDEERLKMGVRGRQLVQSNFTWPSAAQKMLTVYRWLIGEGSKPECMCFT